MRSAFILAVLMLAGCTQEQPSPEAVVPEQAAPTNKCLNPDTYDEECAAKARENNRRAHGDWNSVRSKPTPEESKPQDN